MSKKANADLSRITIAAMDVIGYSEEAIRSRAEFMRRTSSKIGESIKQFYPNIDTDAIATGSRGEGVAKLIESDVDIMLVLRNFLCVDNARLESGLNIIQTISTDSPPGYTKLNPLDMGCDLFGTALFRFTCSYDLKRGQIFVSSACMRNFLDLGSEPSTFLYDGLMREAKQQTGPSVPSSVSLIVPTLVRFEIPTIEMDNVLAMPYFPSTVLDIWKKRKRLWPPPHLCQEVSETEGFVVPVGPSFSEEQNFEWRISFTKAEKILVSRLSSVQLKLYILLKMVFKNIIKPNNCDFISSYMIKNIVFWVAEVNYSDMFTPNKLIDLLLHCLALLRECLNSNFLPNYMIPSRNLLAGKGTPHDRTRMKDTLTDLLNDGGCVVMQIETLRNSISVIGQSPITAIRYSEVRNRVEKLVLLINHMFCSKLSPTSMLQSTFIYDMWFELLKDPFCLEISLSLMNLLNVDPVSVAINPEQYIKFLYSFI